jgi:uncharacterized protein (DUF924 family)
MSLESQKQPQEEILGYWFGALSENETPSSNYYTMWFAMRSDIDRYIKTNFELDLKSAIAGKLKSWNDTPRGTLALIILLDQFSRNMYRGTKKAFAQDSLALEVCLHGINKGFDKKLYPVERLFFYMPLQHSEGLEMQKKSVEYFSNLERLFSSPHHPLAPMISGFKEYADTHYIIIQRFGRFPHRNEILGRESTPGEIEFLNSQGLRFKI